MNLRFKPRETEEGSLAGQATIRASVEEPAPGEALRGSVSGTEKNFNKKSRKQLHYMPLSKLIASLSILLWGILTSLAMIPIINNSKNLYVEDYIATAALVLQGVFCVFGGAFSLVKYPTVARACLYYVSFCFVVIGICLAINQRHAGHPAPLPLMLGISAGIFLFGICFTVVGRWLGHEED